MLFIFKPVAVRNYAVIMSLLPADEIKTNNSFYFPDSLVIPESNNTENNNPSFYLPDDVVAPELENILYIQDIINRTNSLDKTIKNNSRSSLSIWLKDIQNFNSIEDIPNYDELKNEIQNETTNNDEEQQHITVSSVKNKKSKPKKKQVSETILTIAYDIAIKPIPITYIQVVLLPKLN